MLLGARNGMIVKSGTKVTPDSKVEYIESTGAQYIDTGIVPRPGFGFKAVFSVQSIDPNLDSLSLASNGIIGVETDSFSGYGFLVAAYYDGSQPRIWGMVGYGNASYTDEPITLQESYTVEFNYLNSSQVTVNNEITAAVTEQEKQECSIFTKPICLAAVKDQPSGIVVPSKIRIYAMEITDGLSVVARYAPVRVGSGLSAVGYVYDEVSGRIYGNSGTGSFIVGPDKVE